MVERQQEFTITGFPVPPSVNALYAHVRGRMVKSKDYREYERHVYKWLIANPKQVSGVREFLKDLGEYVLDVSAMFHMEKADIICKNGKPKRNDTSNRLKALHDALSTAILGIDDSYFWSCSADKCVGEKEKTSVSIVIKLRNIYAAETTGVCQLRSEEQICETLLEHSEPYQNKDED